MKTSLNWIKEFTSVGLATDELVEKIGAQLGAVEEVIDLCKKYEGILIVKVVTCVKHPDADKLSLCLVDDGGVNKDVKRDNDGLVQVVCGAPNVKAGQLAVWIPPGVTVPSTFDKEPFVIEAREIRGQISNGMLASPKELALGDSHEGILVLDEGRPGEPFAKNFGLDDYIIDIENKMFTHRPDLFGQLGVAREIAGIQRQAFKSPDWYREDASLPADGRKNVLNLAVNNEVPKLVPRFCAVAIKDIKVAPSPAWLQARLSSVGVRPINNIVDLTNFFMLETAQPLHAYDYDKVKTGTLGARLSKKGEKLKLLGGKEITLDGGAVVITDGQNPIGLGGIMGGADTEVDENTRNIILECANFDMNSTRRTAMAYGLFTDAATRFTKNQSPRQNMAVLVKAVDDIKRLAGGRQASEVIDQKHLEKALPPVKTDTDFINRRLGLNLSAAEIKKILENVEFEVSTEAGKLTIKAPFWRTDIEIPEDIVEEVGRLYGYDKLPVGLPKRDLAPAPKDVPLEFKAHLRNLLVRAGANEVLTYSFVPQRLLEAAGQDPAEAYHIRNAVSPDLQSYRLSLAPSLLDKVHSNRKAGFDAFALFEIGKGHIKGWLDDEKLPAEMESLAAVTVNPYIGGAPYFQARRMADFLFDKLNIPMREYRPLDEIQPRKKSSWYNCFEPSRSAVVWAEDHVLGVIGEPVQSLRAALKLPAGTAMFELDIPNLYESQRERPYRPLNRYPSSTQDINLRLPVKINYGEADEFVWKELDKLAGQHGYTYDMETLDIFQRPEDKDHHQITWRITLSHPEKTLTTDEVNKLLDRLAETAKKQLSAERI